MATAQNPAWMDDFLGLLPGTSPAMFNPAIGSVKYPPPVTKTTKPGVPPITTSPPIGTDPNLYGAHDKISSPVASNPQADVVNRAGGQNIGADLMALAGHEPRDPTPGRLAVLAALRHDPQHDSNMATGLPSYAPGSQSPFTTGYFQSHDQRAANETRALGGPGITSATPDQRLAATQATAAATDGMPGVVPIQPHTPVPMNNVMQGGAPTPLTGPQGTPAMDAANLAQSMATYAPHDPTAAPSLGTMLNPQYYKKPPVLTPPTGMNPLPQ